jgi:hypothetical protein
MDVQTAFPTLTFAAPPAPSCGAVCSFRPSLSNGKSFEFSSGSAVLFAIPFGSPAPVPRPLPIFGVLSAFQISRRIRRRLGRTDV